jgi:hypothetical protein
MNPICSLPEGFSSAWLLLLIAVNATAAVVDFRNSRLGGDIATLLGN